MYTMIAASTGSVSESHFWAPADSSSTGQDWERIVVLRIISPPLAKIVFPFPLAAAFWAPGDQIRA
jgi:hypothetical protein